MTENDALPFGRLGRPHGIRGELVLRPFNPGGTPLEQLPLPLQVTVASAKARELLALSAIRRAGDDFLVRFEGVNDRDAAARLTNGELWLPRPVLSPLGPGEVYVQDLVGFEVTDLEGKPRGRVRETVWNGLQDLLVVVNGDEELLIPAVPEYLRQVDSAARRLVVDPHE